MRCPIGASDHSGKSQDHSEPRPAPACCLSRYHELRDIAAKNGSGRLISVHPDLRQALAVYRMLSTGSGPVIRSERGGPMTPLSIVVWFNRAFRNEQKSKGKSERNDRLFAVPRRSHSEQAVRDVQDLSRPIQDELEKFFVATDELEDKKLKIIGWKGPKVALKAIKDAAKSFAKKEQ